MGPGQEQGGLFVAHLELSQSQGARGAPACRTQHLLPGWVDFYFFFFWFNKLFSSLVRRIPTVPK